MAFREVPMFEIREVLRLWLEGEGLRAIARLVRVDRETVRGGRRGRAGVVRDGVELLGQLEALLPGPALTLLLGSPGPIAGLLAADPHDLACGQHAHDPPDSQAEVQRVEPAGAGIELGDHRRAGHAGGDQHPRRRRPWRMSMAWDWP